MKLPRSSVTLSLLSAACIWSSDEHCLGLEEGDVLRIRLVDISTTSPTEPSSDCSVAYGLQPGVELVATLNEFYGGEQCAPAIPDFEPFGAWTWTRVPGQEGRQPVGGRYRVSSDECKAVLQLRLNGEVPTRDASRPATLDLSFMYDGEPYCGPCSTGFNVNVERQ